MQLHASLFENHRLSPITWLLLCFLQGNILLTLDLVKIRCQHKVVIKQVNKEWDCVKDTVDAYRAEIRKLEGHFKGIEFQHVPHNNNVAANVLSKLGCKQALVPAGVFVQDLRKPLIKLLDPDNPDQDQPDQKSSTSPRRADDRKRGRLARAVPNLST
jgi:hypothetical protein